MSLSNLARKCGITSDALDRLLANDVPLSVGAKLHMRSTALQKFVDGEATLGFSRKIGVSLSTAQEMRDKIGKTGAVGFLIGMMIATESDGE